jgi:hypothetical protein
VEGTGVAVAGMGVDGDPQAERMKERKRMRLRKRRSVDKVSILIIYFVTPALACGASVARSVRCDEAISI